MLPAIKSETIHTNNIEPAAVYFFVERTIRKNLPMGATVLAHGHRPNGLYFVAVTTGENLAGKKETGIYMVDVTETNKKQNKNALTKSLRIKYKNLVGQFDGLKCSCHKHVFDAANASEYTSLLPLADIELMTRYYELLEQLRNAPAGALFSATNKLFGGFYFKSNVEGKVLPLRINYSGEPTVRLGRAEPLASHYLTQTLINKAKTPRVVEATGRVAIRGYVFSVDPKTDQAVLVGREITNSAQQLLAVATDYLAFKTSKFEDGSWLA